MIVGNLYGYAKQSMFYGFVLLLAACFNLLGYLWNYLVVYPLNGDFLPINIGLGAACFVSSCALAFVLKMYR